MSRANHRSQGLQMSQFVFGIGFASSYLFVNMPVLPDAKTSVRCVYVHSPATTTSLDMRHSENAPARLAVITTISCAPECPVYDHAR